MSIIDARENVVDGKGRSLVGELKRIFENPPWPGHVAINDDGWRTLKAEVKAATPRKDAASMIGGVPFQPFGLQIVVDETVPPNEIHARSVVHKDGTTWLRTDKIINLGT